LNPRRRKARSIFYGSGGLFFVVSSGPFAGKPVPTGHVLDADFVYDIDHCGSRLAREEARPGSRNLEQTETKKPPDQ
jgi:hypothetical protein